MRKTMAIRPTTGGDGAALKGVVDATQLFPSDMLDAMIAPFLSASGVEDLWLTALDAGEPIGFCYAAPEAMTDRVWNLAAIAIHPQHQGRGFGAALLAALESALRARGARLMIVDTSGQAAFAPTRAFYRKNGYAEEARIRDFWAEGDDKITFWKPLAR